MRQSGASDCNKPLVPGPAYRAPERETVRRLAVSQTLPADRAPCIIVVDSGMLLLETHVPAGADGTDIAALVLPGDRLGSEMIAMLPGASLRAIAPSVVRLLAPQADGPACDVRSTFAMRLLHQLTVISTLAADQRLATLLVLLGGQLGRRSGNSVKFELPLSRSEMAHYLALNPETLSRAITRFKSRQIVKTVGRRNVTILDWEALCRSTPLAEPVLAGTAPAQPPCAAGSFDGPAQRQG